jgi:hypothetical protein
MNFEKVLFAFFIILALSLNFGFFFGDIDNPNHHHAYELFAALIASLVCTVMKFGDRTQYGSTVLASSLVADLQLICAALVWGISTHVLNQPISQNIAIIVSLSGGALVANLISTFLLMAETIQSKR